MPFIVTGGRWEDQGFFETYSNPQWDAGARTIVTLDGNGAFSFSVGQATGIVCGLNNLDLDADYLEIEHGFYLENGLAKVVENGVYKSAFSSYTPLTSVFKIERIDGVVKYFIDGVLKYTSLLESTGVVFLDCSLFAANDSIINVSMENDAVAKYGPSLHIVLPKAELTFLESDDTALLNIELPRPTIQIETPDVSTLEFSLSKPDVFLLEEGISLLNFDLPKPTVYIRESLIVPDYAVLQITVPKIQIRINEAENLSLNITLPKTGVVISEVDSFLHIELQKPILGFQEATQNFFLMSWPRWTLSASLLMNEVIFTIPAPIVSITGTNHSSTVSFTIPAPTLTAYSGASTELTIPAPSLTITGTTQNLGRVEFEIPEPVLTIAGFAGAMATVDVVIPALELAAYSGGVTALTLPALELAVAGTVNSVAHIAFELPILEPSISGTVSSVARVAFEIPSPILYAGMGNWVALEIPSPILVVVASPALTTAETTYAINLNTGAVTQLLLGGFDKLVTAHGRLYGLKNGALTRLDGNVDGTATTIPATIRFAPQTFGTNQVKRISDVYWSTREADGITMELVADERTVWRYQTPTDTAPAFGTHKIKTGRGVTFHTAGLTLRNRDGGMLDVGGVELLVSALSRKPK